MLSCTGCRQRNCTIDASVRVCRKHIHSVNIETILELFYGPTTQIMSPENIVKQ